MRVLLFLIIALAFRRVQQADPRLKANRFFVGYLIASIVSKEEGTAWSEGSPWFDFGLSVKLHFLEILTSIT
eukprot:CAMPEP_0194154076 /NCGR_PEP_ID=MMETSP0152-20130528/59078_1 /TAXON_ID=1049557 /ORGANISM="Thalassiothrix antarctica, Strain L6-D1" /LENGTH=71 /DNA_ID=CAMNT_0038859869 /DNA_START=122 /DNA_END=337 /DNA_ORIENTATION=-